MEAKPFEAITTQEQLDARVEPLLAAEREKYKDYETLKIQAGQVEGLQTQVADLTARLAALQNESLQHRIAHEEGLPWELAGRLSGKDEKAMRADAQALAKFVARKPQRAAPLRDPEPEPTNTKTAALKEVLGKLRKE